MHFWCNFFQVIIFFGDVFSVISVINTRTVEKEEPIIPPQMFDEKKNSVFSATVL